MEVELEVVVSPPGFGELGPCADSKNSLGLNHSPATKGMYQDTWLYSFQAKNVYHQGKD